MIAYKYYEKLYTIKPLTIATDISDYGLRIALHMLNFELEREYILHISRAYLEFLPKISNGILNMKVELIDNPVDGDEWYVVCPTTKTIAYSPGA